MSEQVAEVQATETTTQQVTPTTQAAPATQAATVDMDSITKAAEARAERAAQAVVKDMLTKQGLDDTAIQGVLAEWKSKQTTPETEIKQHKETIKSLKEQVALAEQREIALSKGVPITSADEATKDKVTACLTLAKSYMSETVPYEAALDKALAIIGFEAPKITPPAFYAGTGKNSMVGVDGEKQKALDAAKAAMRIK